MLIITHEIYIHAPIRICFDLARNVDIHTETTAKTKERAIAGVTTGLMEEFKLLLYKVYAPEL